MKIRRMRMKDYEEMIRLWSRAKLPFKPKVRDSKESITAQMKVNPDYFLGAFEGNRLIGSVIISCDNRKGWINRLAVDTRYRRHGVATKLIARAETVLRKHGIRIFAAQIEESNAASKRLFRKCGYVEHRDIIYFSKRDSDDV